MIDRSEVIEWHRQQAKVYEAAAKQHLAMVEMLANLPEASPIRFKRVATDNGQTLVQPATAQPTLAQLESALAEKRGRPAHLAQRLNTTTGVINTLLRDPNSKYHIGLRGFIYPKG